MSNPVLTVKVDWAGDGSFADAIDDISPYVEKMTDIRGGAGDFASGTPASGATLVLLNDDGRFTPHNSGGPLYGLLRPNRRVWVTATYSATTYGLFAGRVANIAVDPALPSRAYLLCEGLDLSPRRSDVVVAPLTTRSAADYRAAILDAIGITSRLLAPEMDTLPLTGGQSSTAQTLMDELNRATGTRHFIRPGSTGWYQYVSVSRQHRLDAAVDESISDVGLYDSLDSSGDGIGNLQRVVTTPAILSSPTTIWTAPVVPFAVKAGLTRRFWAMLSDFAVDISAVTVKTGTATVDVAAYGSAASVVVTATTDTIVSALTLVGRIATRGSGIAVDAQDDTSRLAANYGPRGMPDVSTDLLTPTLGQGLADHLVWRRKDPRMRLSISRLNVFPTAFVRELYDDVALTMPRLSLVGRRFEVVGISRTIEPGADVNLTYLLQEAPSQTVLSFFKVGGSAAEGVGGSGVLAR
jgi:hypothetical protein